MTSPHASIDVRNSFCSWTGLDRIGLDISGCYQSRNGRIFLAGVEGAVCLCVLCLFVLFVCSGA